MCRLVWMMIDDFSSGLCSEFETPGRIGLGSWGTENGSKLKVLFGL